MDSGRFEPGGTDRDGRIEFFEDGPLSSHEELELLNFLMVHFNCQQPVALNGDLNSVATQFVLRQYERHNTKIDLLYLDGASLHRSTPGLIAQLCGLISRKGIVFVRLGDTTKQLDPSIFLERSFDVALMVAGFTVFSRLDGELPLRSVRYQIDLFRRKLHFVRQRRLMGSRETLVPDVVVIVLTYKHENYISECLLSVLRQRGQFRMRIFVIDDASPDGTLKVVNSLISQYVNDDTQINVRANLSNVGVVANLAAAFEKAAGCDYLTFCEGDDFWVADDRIQKHIDFLDAHPRCVFSFNSMELCDANGGARATFEAHAQLGPAELDGIELASENFIGNFSACFYRGELLKVVPSQIFRIYTVDWFLNIYCAQFGRIGHVKEVLSVYRQHAAGEWSSRRTIDKALELIKLIGQYDRFLDYQYTEAFQRYHIRIYATLNHTYLGEQGKIDLLIIDDVFPSPKSGFRYAEFSSYLRAFDSSLVLATGRSLHVVEQNTIADTIENYQKKNLDISHKVLHCDGGFPLRLARLVYLNFLTNAYLHLAEIEAARVPFIFTLYPGAGFVLNDADCDRKLRRVFDSPCFQKVIVTQTVTYNYILGSGMCPAEKVEMIFGVVMPEVCCENAIRSKQRWGYGKERLDICFMAHRYTPHGEDKGYDVFINVAGILLQRYDNIYFHVVGPFDSRVIDVRALGSHIVFHGSLNPDDFDDFFSGMDIIVSPNISGKISRGSFDGFPTASCVEAGMRGVAIFAIDEFDSSRGNFADGEDIVLIRYDLIDIVEKVERFYADPNALRTVGERGADCVQKLYGAGAQLAPRISLLRQALAGASELASNTIDAAPFQVPAGPIAMTVRSRVRRSLDLVARVCPEPVKRAYRAWRGNRAVQ